MGTEHRAQGIEHGASSDSPPWRGKGWVYGKGTGHRDMRCEI